MDKRKFVTELCSRKCQCQLPCCVLNFTNLWHFMLTMQLFSGCPYNNCWISLIYANLCWICSCFLVALHCWFRRALPFLLRSAPCYYWWRGTSLGAPTCGSESCECIYIDLSINSFSDSSIVFNYRCSLLWHLHCMHGSHLDGKSGVHRGHENGLSISLSLP